MSSIPFRDVSGREKHVNQNAKTSLNDAELKAVVGGYGESLRPWLQDPPPKPKEPITHTPDGSQTS